MKGTKGKGEKDKKGKCKEKGKGKKDNGESKGKAQPDDSYFAGECGYCGKEGHKKVQRRKQKKDQGSKPCVRPFRVISTGQCVLSFVGPYPSLCCRVVCSFLRSCSCFCPCPGLPFGFVVRAGPSTGLVVLQTFGFLSTVSRHVSIDSTP